MICGMNKRALKCMINGQVLSFNRYIGENVNDLEQNAFSSSLILLLVRVGKLQDRSKEK